MFVLDLSEPVKEPLPKSMAEAEEGIWYVCKYCRYYPSPFYLCTKQGADEIYVLTEDGACHHLDPTYKDRYIPIRKIGQISIKF